MPAPSEAQLKIIDSTTKAMILEEKERERDVGDGEIQTKTHGERQMNQLVFVPAIFSSFSPS